jgi:hypothetical protein
MKRGVSLEQSDLCKNIGLSGCFGVCVHEWMTVGVAK